jgi:drug/metabolite transporter (DMT)-like permease
MTKFKRSTVILASIGMLLATAIWGFAFVVVKEAVDVITPLYMLAFRFTIASVVLTVIFIPKLKNLTKKIWLHGACLGFWLFLAYVVQTWGCKYTTAGKNAFITVTYVVIVPLLAWLFFKEKIDAWSIVSAILALIGVGFLSLNGVSGINKGDFLTLICGILYAVQMIYVDHYTKKEDPILLTLVQIYAATVLSWVSAPLMDGPVPVASLSQDMIVAMLYLGIASSAIAFVLQNVGQKYTPPTTAAVLLSMESVFGVLFSVMLLGEQMDSKMFAGCVIMFVAIIMAETKFQFLPFAKKKEEYDVG